MSASAGRAACDLGVDHGMAWCLLCLEVCGSAWYHEVLWYYSSYLPCGTSWV